MQATCSAIKGVAGRGSRAKGRRGGPAEGRKKKMVTSLLIAEVVVDMPKRTLDSYPAVQFL